jgi:hypothetical protein
MLDNRPASIAAMLLRCRCSLICELRPYLRIGSLICELVRGAQNKFAPQRMAETTAKRGLCRQFSAATQFTNIAHRTADSRTRNRRRTLKPLFRLRFAPSPIHETQSTDMRFGRNAHLRQRATLRCDDLNSGKRAAGDPDRCHLVVSCT